VPGQAAAPLTPIPQATAKTNIWSAAQITDVPILVGAYAAVQRQSGR